ncbi:MAG: hypothetical protein LBK29_01000 [Oscillospiraceae bacterium]|nr:hypothetical protein [Oscillospiraceae bacterium]
MKKILFLCGGCSPERNISLNSARSVYNCIEREYDIRIVFFNKNLEKYLITGEFLYSNTTSDFDFKLLNEGKILSDEQFRQELKQSDVVFPIMHGVFGEDGQIQKILEEEGVTFVGSGSKECSYMYNKENAENFIIKKNGFKSVPKLFLSPEENNIENKISDFFNENSLSEAIVKPTEGGSSFGVKHARNLKNALEISKNMIEKEKKKILIEKRCVGKEFTVIILQNLDGDPVSLIPTEIEVKDSDNIIFDTRRKYLSTNETHYHCPPRFEREQIEKIREKASSLFSLCGAKDFLRIDGWILDDGEIYFSDFNPISGMEQNSFIFQQSAKIGFTHREVINYLINSCLKNKNSKNFDNSVSESDNDSLDEGKSGKITVNVIFGGSTSERQVSLLSGSNVWLKFLKSKKYYPRPFMLFEENGARKVISLPYAMVLNHTVEEILHQFKNNDSDFPDLANEIRIKLGLEKKSFEEPAIMTLNEFLNDSKEEKAFVFLALHGGFGENGGIQKELENLNIPFNGSGSRASEICMNKFKTGSLVNSIGFSGLRSAKKKVMSVSFVINNFGDKLENIWNELVSDLGKRILIKPNCDGCSTGVVVLENKEDFAVYSKLLRNGAEFIPENSFTRSNEKIAMGRGTEEFLFEEFIETDKIEIVEGKLECTQKMGWIELTVTVFESDRKYFSFNPSITVSNSGDVLSVEEKFQGGTGVNITPPPEFLINSSLLEKIKRYTEITAAKIGIKNYCRVDIFANNITGEVVIIEINTLPALTPSTVLFQQASKEKPPVKPLDFLEKMINI